MVLVLLLSCNTYKTFYKETYAISGAVVKTAQRLDLRQAPYDSIVKWLPYYENVRFLNLSTKSEAEVNAVLQLIAAPKLLRVLILDSVGLRRLPKQVQRFPNLKQLSLNANPNLDFDEAFRRLEGLPLVFLNLQHNQLTTLPEGIVALQHITDLNLSYNNVHTPVSFTRLKTLPKLKSLWLTSNQLEVLPETLFQLDTLKNLYIEHNALSHIPEGIIGMKRVWVIHAGYNKFKVMPNAFSKMDCLFLLHINHCEIESIPEGFTEKQSKVAGLILDGNRLSEKAKRYWRKTFQHFFLLSL
jgi:Leucine-rich repeat (LRR) protein